MVFHFGNDFHSNSIMNGQILWKNPKIGIERARALPHYQYQKSFT